jgi:hypothetical protein
VRAPSEDAFQRTLIDYARLRGYKVAHFRKARTKHGWRTAVMADGKGWPDLVLVRGPTILFVELKMDGACPTAEQAAWLSRLRLAGQTALVWTPRMWPEIEEILR